MNKQQFYAIKDNETGEWWKSERGHSVWGRRCSATSAWNAGEAGYYGGVRLPTLHQQSRYQMVKVGLVEVSP